MTAVVASSGFFIPCCKPTKDGLAWITTRLLRAFDAFNLTSFLTHRSALRRRDLAFRLPLWPRFIHHSRLAARILETGDFSNVSFRTRDCTRVDRGELRADGR
jgi:hypothetical protein